MQSSSAPNSKGMFWTGWIITILITLFMLFDITLHFLKPAMVITATQQLGYPINILVPLAIVELIAVILFVLPRSAIFGAALLTAFYGGATATHVRVGQPFYFPVIFGILVWIALALRDTRLRNIILGDR